MEPVYELDGADVGGRAQDASERARVSPARSADRSDDREIIGFKHGIGPVKPAPVVAEAPVGLGSFLVDPAHWRILVDLFGIAVSGGVFVVPLYALLQAVSERQRRAQTIAANNVINAAAMVVASVATMGLLAAGVSVPGLFLLTGSLTLGVALLAWRSLPSCAFGPEVSETLHQ